MKDREKNIFDFLEHPELIKRVHRSEAILKDNTAKFNDMYLIPGKRYLPKEFHQTIKALDCMKTPEQHVSDEEHIFSFEFIDSL